MKCRKTSALFVTFDVLVFLTQPDTHGVITVFEVMHKINSDWNYLHFWIINSNVTIP